ncbi:MAG: hypothetical protein K9G46_14030 [Flavobacteriales bacterium]|nr:hypothetical protein [Flavobacteriales bacterium]
MKLLPLILCFLPFSLFAQYQVILNSGDTVKVSNLIKDGDYYTVEKYDGQTSRLPYTLVKSVLRDYSTTGIKAPFIYCQLVGTGKLFSPEVTVSVDYGQQRGFFDDYRIRDETGNVQSFNSMIDALNYMASMGWKFAQAYTITIGQQNVYHYLLKKAT